MQIGTVLLDIHIDKLSLASHTGQETRPSMRANTGGIKTALTIQAKSFEELQQKWCAAKRDVGHIFVLPASLFVDSRELLCDTGTYKLYRVVSVDDPDDFEYYIDPPFGKENRLGCDGKAGLKTKVVAVNCRPE